MIEMIEMTLSSRHRIRNFSPGDLRPSTLPLGHKAPRNTDFHTWMGKKLFFLFLSNRRDREPNPELRRERQRMPKGYSELTGYKKTLPTTLSLSTGGPQKNRKK